MSLGTGDSPCFFPLKEKPHFEISGWWLDVIVITTGCQDPARLRDASFVAQISPQGGHMLSLSTPHHNRPHSGWLSSAASVPLSSRLLGISVSPPCLSWSTGRTGGACLSFGDWVLYWDWDWGVDSVSEGLLRVVGGSVMCEGKGAITLSLCCDWSAKRRR